MPCLHPLNKLVGSIFPAATAFQPCFFCSEFDTCCFSADDVDCDYVPGNDSSVCKSLAGDSQHMLYTEKLFAFAEAGVLFSHCQSHKGGVNAVQCLPSSQGSLALSAGVHAPCSVHIHLPWGHVKRCTLHRTLQLHWAPLFLVTMHQELLIFGCLADAPATSLLSQATALVPSE